MTGSNLVPEYRTDRNGRNVLRHVRSGKHETGSQALAATAPSVVAKPDRELFSDSFRLFWDRQEICNTGYSEESFDPRAVSVFNGIFSSDSHHEPFQLMAALSRGFNEVIGAGEESDGIVSVHNIAAFADGIHHLRDIRQSIEGLHLTLGTRKDYLLDADDDERDVAIAIMKATEVVGDRIDWEDNIGLDHEKYGICMSIKKPELTALIVEFTPRIDDLLELIEGETHMMDIQTLRDVLTHDQQALAKGVL